MHRVVTPLNTANLYVFSILTATFSGAAKTYSRVVPWVMYLLKGVLAGNTPRKVFMKTVSWTNLKLPSKVR